MSASGMIDQTIVRNIFFYNPSTGIFVNKYDREKRGKRAGEVATFEHTSGYLCLHVMGKSYLAHRIAWLWCYGYFPCGFIDHINHNKSDNRLANLRVVSHQDNHRNQPLRVDNTSGHPGVTWVKWRWRARINSGNRRIHLGYFESYSDAVLARVEAEHLYGFHPNHGTTLKNGNNL